jgi:broad specificity phosphatase PhoE
MAGLDFGPEVSLIAGMSATSSAGRFVRWSPLFGVLLGSSLAAGSWWVLRCGEATTLVLVRHADRDGSRDALTADGVARSRALLHAVEKLGLAAVYHSDTVRARDTAVPLASALALATREHPAADVAGLLRDIFEQHRGQRVLVVGHGNTVPQIIAAAGGPELPDIAHDEFDDLFVLTTRRCGRRGTELSRLQYGEPSP